FRWESGSDVLTALGKRLSMSFVKGHRLRGIDMQCRAVGVPAPAKPFPSDVPLRKKGAAQVCLYQSKNVLTWPKHEPGRPRKEVDAYDIRNNSSNSAGMGSCPMRCTRDEK